LSLHSFPTRRSSDLLKLLPMGSGMVLVLIQGGLFGEEGLASHFQTNFFHLRRQEITQVTGNPRLLVQSGFDLLYRILHFFRLATDVLSNLFAEFKKIRFLVGQQLRASHWAMPRANSQRSQ